MEMCAEIQAHTKATGDVNMPADVPSLIAMGFVAVPEHEYEGQVIKHWLIRLTQIRRSLKKTNEVDQRAAKLFELMKTRDGKLKIAASFPGQRRS